MGLGEDLQDVSGQNITHALEAEPTLSFLSLFLPGYGVVVQKSSKDFGFSPKSGGQQLPFEPLISGGEYQYQLNVAPLVKVIKDAGSDWRGGQQLREWLAAKVSELCRTLRMVEKARIKNNDLNTVRGSKKRGSLLSLYRIL